MKNMQDQFIFDFPTRAAQDADNFLVSPNSAAALELIDLWPDWQDKIRYFAGPEASGKTHLINVWRHRSGARKIAARQLTPEMIPSIARLQNIAVEDIDQGLKDETTLFHLFNLAKENKLRLLLTSRCLPGELDIKLPDLRSRLRAIPVTQIQSQDDALTYAIMIKLLADRQLDIKPEVTKYIFDRIERSLPAMIAFLGKLDKAAMRDGRKITKQFASRLLT